MPTLATLQKLVTQQVLSLKPTPIKIMKSKPTKESTQTDSVSPRLLNDRVTKLSHPGRYITYYL